MGKIKAIKGLGKAFEEAQKFLKTKGDMETDPAVRQGIAIAKKDMKKKGYIGLKAKKIPKDLSYMKGYLGE
jgi:hypothetical protein|tara:strand:- start:4188 stop:4400 length:213 start_codon:yes stop_codon:yes gene_type:complete